MATKVMAKEMGFYFGRRIRPGETFILKPGQKPGKWMEVISEVEEPKAKEPKAKKESAKEPAKEPGTFSEISKSMPTPKGADLPA